MAYVPLHVHSYYSLGRGTAGPQNLVAQAKAHGCPALALTDSASLYAAVPFYQAAWDAGIRPILGAHVPTETGSAVLLARDASGYRNLCQLVTQTRLGPAGASRPDSDSARSETLGLEYGGARPSELAPLSADQIAGHGAGLFILTECPAMMERLLPRIGPAALAAEIVRPPRSHAAERELLELASRHHIRIVGTTAATMLHPANFPIHRLLAAVRDNVLLTQVAADSLSLPGHSLCSPEEFENRFRDLPEAVRGTREIADACDLKLSLGTPIFPHYPRPTDETAAAMLQRLARDGLRTRYQPVTSAAEARLRYELEIIHRLGFDEYFLVVADILRFARSRGIPNVGRGSGASSIVSYTLGITHVDPIRHNIHFERFLNLSRSDCPDIDIDLCWQRRDEVIDYVFRRYGAAHTAMISTHNTFRGRGALRDVAKAWGVSSNDVGRLADRLDLRPDTPLDDAVRNAPESLDLSEDRLRQIVQQAQILIGFPHHLSVHCGGVVISPDTIDTYTPLQRAAKGVIVTQFEMRAIEDIGLVKIDLLGNRALSTIDEALRLLRTSQGTNLSPDTIPADDPPTFAMIRRGLTVGVNQLESPAMRNLLQMCMPERVEDIIAALALVRPGAASAGMKEEYVRRRRGLSPVTFLHPAVADVLHDSLGILLYEDDTTLVGSRIAGLTLEDGDRFRKAVQKTRDAAARQRLAAWFVRRCGRRGVAAGTARALWSQMDKFRSYSFCKSHACGYGLIAYQCAYLKCHFPAEFMVAVLNHHAGMYSKSVHAEEAKRLGVRMRLPCVNRSDAPFRVDEGAIRVGFGQVRCLSDSAIRDILAARDHGGAFLSLNDFLSRTRIAEPEVDALILCGAFDFTQCPRTALLWELKTTFQTERRAQSSVRLFHGNFHRSGTPPLNDLSAPERRSHEFRILELSTGPHVLADLRNAVSVPRLTDSRHLRDHIGQRVRIIGMRDATRSVETSRGDTMEFITFEDEYGLWECTLFPRSCRRGVGTLGAWGPYLVDGLVDEQYGAVTVNAHRLRLLPVQ